MVESEVQQLTEDGKVTKRILKAGFGKLPDKHDVVTIHYESFLAKTNLKYDSSRDRLMEYIFTLGTDEGKVIQGWEIAIPTMKVGEVAEIICSHSYAYGEDGLHPLVPPKAKIRCEVELLSASPCVEDKAREKLDIAKAKKEEGTELFKHGQIVPALYTYRVASHYVLDLWQCTFDELGECRELTVAIQLNVAICQMKLQRWSDAIETLNYVLERDPSTVKAYYRLGQVYMEQMEYEQGIDIVKEGLKAIPKNPELTSLLATLEQKSKSSLQDSTRVYRKMFA
ncbi:uncharacterized protein BX664DRAFT_385763 [Halteromyces radiatus]|uniref:uncharacterized protein n=1 Tax=Halteromyces radiatus TaxID=101107 RepID=UPI0022208872|nr:uncharacterized protein BX664DRAFT_385763 [Halteromyces radiatus]KAI8089242.1 hypothetical protein BX664DRAFT_385763 [Halteromyces radiatus]